RHTATDWDTALDRLGQLVRGTSGSALILASGRASIESLGLVRMMLGKLDVTAAVQVPLGDEAPLAGIPDLALRRERAPNLAGAELLGYRPSWEEALRSADGAGLIVVLDADLTDSDQALLAATPGSLVVLGTVWPDGLRNADLVLPITNMAEENGTYVNRDRRIQRFTQAKSQPGMARPAWWVAGEVLAGPGPSPTAPSTAAEAFLLLGERWPAFAGLTHADMGFTGRVLGLALDRSAESQQADLGVV
ncbi:MAG TPA: molybdopterin-dependent oxidoreductase, partial [Gemmatimonadales bacterium]|nr:molybdopterin-dependent oxidoreductase [Gemmatimonadales bacterium]